MNQFTAVILCHLLEDLAGIRQTCLLWLEQYPRDSRKAAQEFASQLAEDFREDRFGNCSLTNSLLDAAYSRVNWLAIARDLLRRFTPQHHDDYVATPSPN